jgi:energy-coupling factor transporter ATP-binding protein EcfA2
MDQKEQQQLTFRVGKVFSPAAPINTLDLFAGRNKQMQRAGDAVNTRGQHAIVFGERGVGKTSLANILNDLLAGEDTVVVKVNCVQDDTFEGVWRKALTEVDLEEQLPAFGFARQSAGSVTTNLADLLGERAGPGEVRRVLQRLSRELQLIFIFDEFDRLREQKTQRMFADTIKDLSDNSVNATLVLVGVAEDVDDLIQEHASIDRCLVQIQMPRMSIAELQDIVRTACAALEMSIDPDGLELIVLLSQGLPHYTHLLGKESFITALGSGRKEVRLEDVKDGVSSAVENSLESVQSAYQKATKSQRKGTLFRQVLLACALAEVDEQGYFVSTDLREPLLKITGKSYDIPNFSQHLDKFSSDVTRGPVLEKAGTTRRFRFRFANPLLQPFVLMRGLADGVVTGDLLELLRRKQAK